MITFLYMLAVILLLIWTISSPFHWRSKKIPYLVPWPIFGNFFGIFPLGINDFFAELYKKFPREKFYGLHLFTRPVLFVKDPEIMQKILVTDFDHFTSHGFYTNQDRDPAGGNLFVIHGQQWKEMRSRLTPFFTPAKILTMVSYVDKSLPKLTAIFDKNAREGVPVEMRQNLFKVTVDVIAQAIFGIHSDIFENENSLFSEIAKGMLDAKQTSRIFVGIISKQLFDACRLTLFGDLYNQYVKTIVTKSIDVRRDEQSTRQDFIQGMINLIDTKYSEEQKYFPDGTRVPKYDLNTAVTQGLLLYTAGTETSALTMTFCLYELAVHPDIQQKCREEVLEVLKKDGGDTITAENMSSLVYLSAAIQETLRLHSILNLFPRECTKDYKVPDSDFTIEKGTFILMSTLSLHMDPKYHPEPEVFRPERFLGEEKNAMKNASYMPFGSGPRVCIGMKFARLEMLLILSRLLQRYEFTVSSRLTVPLKHASHTLGTTPADGVWLNVKPIS